MGKGISQSPPDIRGSLYHREVGAEGAGYLPTAATHSPARLMAEQAPGARLFLPAPQEL